MPKRLGFIGGSINSAVGYTHYIASRMDNKWKLVAGAFSTDGDVNARTADLYGANDDYVDWRRMVHEYKDCLDAIAILTPTPMHYEMVMACIEAGYPVICEKALCTSSKQAEEIIAKGGDVAVTYNYTGYPMVREMRAAIGAHFLGQIKHIQVEMPQDGYLRQSKVQDWRMKDGYIPTLYLDLADHIIHLVYYLTGEHPVCVAADHGSHGNIDVVDNVSFLARYEGGLQCQGWFGKSALGYKNGMKIRIFGNLASAEWTQSNPEVLMIHSVDGTTQRMERGSTCLEANMPRYNRFKAGHPSGFIEAFANLYSDLSEGTPTEYKPHVARDGLKTMEALVRANEIGAWVPVDESTAIEHLLREKKPKDSMGLISFVAEVEKEFDIELTEDEIHQDDFLTVDGLTKIVEAKR